MDDTEVTGPTPVWVKRHAWIVGLLSVQALALTAATFAWGSSPFFGLIPILTCVGPAVVSALPRRSQLLTAGVSAASLMAQAGFTVALFSGTLRANVLMLAVLCVVALYEVGVVVAVTFTVTTIAVVLLTAFDSNLITFDDFGRGDDTVSLIAALGATAIALFALAVLWRSTREARFEAEEQRRAMEAYLDVSSSLMVILDRDARVTFANRQTCRTLDREPHELVGESWFGLAVPEEHRAINERSFRENLAYWEEQGTTISMPQDFENTILTRDGTPRTVVWWATVICDRHGKAKQMVCSGDDVTEIREDRASLRRAGLELDALRRLAQKVASLDDSRQAVVDAAIDLAGASMVGIMEPDRTRSRIRFTTATIPELVDWTLELGVDEARAADAFLTGQPAFIPDLSNAPGTHRGLVELTGAVSALHQPIMSANGTIGVLSVAWSEPVHSLNERRAELVGLIAHEAAIALRRRESLAQLERAALVDPLTGVANRRAFDAELPAVLRRATQFATTPGLIAMDLNDFKDVNDRLGHEAGDDVLIKAAAAWTDALRAGDLLARLGGDEFAVLLPSCDDHELQHIVERLRRVTPHGPGASIGGVIWDGAESASGLIRRSDEAQYVNKAAIKKRLDELGIPHGRGRGPVNERPPRPDPRAETLPPGTRKDA